MSKRRVEVDDIRLSGTRASKKPKTDGGSDQRERRQAYALAPQMDNHILFLFAGNPPQLITLHSSLLDPATATYLHNRFHAQGFCYLPEEDLEIVHLWRMFLYTGNVYSDNETTDQDAPDEGEETHADGEWTKLAHAYFFAQMVEDEAFSNACVTALIEKVKETERFPTGIASEVYGYTEPGDGLRALIVQFHVYIGEGTCVEAPHEDADGPEEFLEDVKAELEMAEATDWLYRDTWERDPCMFHEHKRTEKCGA